MKNWFKFMKFSKILTILGLTSPLFISIFLSNSPVEAKEKVFGDRNAAGQNANIPRLAPDYNRIIAACVDGWRDDVRCEKNAHQEIAYQFCLLNNYKEVVEWVTRRNYNKTHEAWVLNMGDKKFYGRVATSNPLFFTEITCSN